MAWAAGHVVILGVAGTAEVEQTSTSYTIDTFAGHDDATLNRTSDLAVDVMGAVYIAGTFNHRVRVLTPPSTPVPPGESETPAVDP